MRSRLKGRVTFMNHEKIAEAVNVLGAFCGMRDVPELSKEALQERYGIRQAKVMVLFGGSVLGGGDELAKAMQSGVAERYMIVGGEGHTTEELRHIVNQEYPDVDCRETSEAEIFAAFLKRKYDLAPDLLEIHSTNCGNNITNMLLLLDAHGFARDSVILMQDATMQRRMDAVMRKFAVNTTIINYASYAVRLNVDGDGFTFDPDVLGMWEVERYINLLLGEVQRLTDDADGYGPQGRDFIAHVDIPQEVYHAFAQLRQEYGGAVRGANPLYATEE